MTRIARIDEFDPLEEYQSQAPTFGDWVVIKDILDSYHSNYDLFAEILQNSVDAVEERMITSGDEFRPAIAIHVDLQTNEILAVRRGFLLSGNVRQTPEGSSARAIPDVASSDMVSI